MTDLRENRVALISVLAEGSPLGHIGRTGVMKLLYFLQTVRDVPLEYRFTLYSYGPFDSDVLADLSTAEVLGIVSSTVVEFPGGYGYRITAGPHARWLQGRAHKFLKRHSGDVKWVIRNFGDMNSSQLELVSTILYADRDAAEDDQALSMDVLVEMVKDVKPHFSRQEIMDYARKLRHDGLLEASS
jgi:uncharacterized protein